MEGELKGGAGGSAPAQLSNQPPAPFARGALGAAQSPPSAPRGARCVCVCGGGGPSPRRALHLDARRAAERLGGGVEQDLPHPDRQRHVVLQLLADAQGVRLALALELGLRFPVWCARCGAVGGVANHILCTPRRLPEASLGRGMGSEAAPLQARARRQQRHGGGGSPLSHPKPQTKLESPRYPTPRPTRPQIRGRRAQAGMECVACSFSLVSTPLLKRCPHP